MAVFTSTAAQSTSQAIFRENGTISRTVTFIPVTAASAGDVLQMVKVPAGAIIQTVGLSVSFSAGANTVNMGDGNDTSAYGASIVMSGSVVALTSMTHRGMGRSYSVEDTIDIQIAAVSAPPTSARYCLNVTYTCQAGDGQ